MDQPPASLRGLKALVGVLGVLIVLGTALVVGVIVHRLYASGDATSNVGAPAGLAPAAGGLALPRGSKILGIAAAGARIAIWVGGPGGDTVWLLDPQTGAVATALTAPR